MKESGPHLKFEIYIAFNFLFLLMKSAAAIIFCPDLQYISGYLSAISFVSRGRKSIGMAITFISLNFFGRSRFNPESQPLYGLLINTTALLDSPLFNTGSLHALSVNPLITSSPLFFILFANLSCSSCAAFIAFFIFDGGTPNSFPIFINSFSTVLSPLWNRIGGVNSLTPLFSIFMAAFIIYGAD